jgi:ubiquinone/menaquinone biosynthesis C-methylase UbiE
MHDRRFSASEAHRLDNPERRQWLPPDEVLEQLALQPGNVIADVGAGTGYFALPIAQAVSPDGLVYAVDGQAEMLAFLKRNLQESQISNISMVCAEADHTGLTASSCDLFLLANLWHEIDDHVAVLQEVRRVLKPGGRIAILDWRTDVAPQPGPPLPHRVSAEQAIQTLNSMGFGQISSIDVGSYSWMVRGEFAP